MGSRKKRTIWLLSMFGGLLVLAAALLLLLPEVLDTDRVKQEIQARVSQRTGGRVRFEAIDVAFLPRPGVTIHRGDVAIPGKISGSFDALTAYPEIGPLFHGDLKLAELSVESPRAVLPMTEPKKAAGEGPPASADWARTVSESLRRAGAGVPDFDVSVRDGTLEFLRSGERLLHLEEITATLLPQADGAEIELTATSDLCDRITLKGSLKDKDPRGEGLLELKGLRPHRIPDSFIPKRPFRLGETLADITLRFRAAEGSGFQARLAAGLPSMRVHKGAETLTIQAVRLEAGLTAAGERYSLSLDRLDAAAPDLKVSGRIDYDGSSPRVRAVLDARDVAVASLRHAILFLVGDDPRVQDIFGVVRSGRVPEITIQAEAPTLVEAVELKNLVIQGNIADGEVIIPEAYTGLQGVDFRLQEVTGETLIAKGVLEARNAEARWENAKAREGSVSVDLIGEESRLYIETVAEVDLSDLPSLERRLLRSDAIAGELMRTREIRGRAVARFVLDDRTKPMMIRVNVSEMEMAARHELLPHELRITRGEVAYEADRIQFKDFQAAMGPSSVSDLSMTVALGAAPSLEVRSGIFNLSLTDLHPWAASFDPVAERLQNHVTEIAGSLSLSLHHLRAPLTEMNVQDIEVDMSGTIEDVILTSPLLPAELHLLTGEFEEKGDILSVTGARVDLLDASLRVSGVVPDYLKGFHRLEAAFQGQGGEEALIWASRLAGVPPGLRMQSPLEIEAAELQWTRGGRTQIAAEFFVNGAAKVRVKAGFDSRGVDVEELTIQDPDSTVSVAMHLEEREVHLNYDGRLSHLTMDRLLARNRVLAGVVAGNVDAHIFLDRPMKSTATGSLHGAGLIGTPVLGIPITVEDMVLEARGDMVEVKAASATWAETHVSGKGHVAFSEKYFVFDMDVTGDLLHWRHIREAAAAEEKTGEVTEGSTVYPPVSGVLRVSVDRLETDRFVFEPVRVDIKLEEAAVTMDVREANLCAIPLSGTVVLTEEIVSLDLTASGEGENVEPFVSCFTGGRERVTGKYVYQARVHGDGPRGGWVDSLKGTQRIEAREGRIYRDPGLARVLRYLHVTGFLKGTYPGFDKEGFAYNTIQIEGQLEEGVWQVTRYLLDGVTVDVAGTGKLHLEDMRFDFTALVSPFTTVDAVIKRIPGINYLTGGSLVALPVRVSGTPDDVRVTPLSPKTVGSSLLGLLGRIVKAPVKVMESVVPKDPD